MLHSDVSNLYIYNLGKSSQKSLFPRFASPKKWTIGLYLFKRIFWSYLTGEKFQLGEKSHWSIEISLKRVNETWLKGNPLQNHLQFFRWFYPSFPLLLLPNIWNIKNNPGKFICWWSNWFFHVIDPNYRYHIFPLRYLLETKRTSNGHRKN